MSSESKQGQADEKAHLACPEQRRRVALLRLARRTAESASARRSSRALHLSLFDQPANLAQYNTPLLQRTQSLLRVDRLTAIDD
jgi:hypothetical protein